MKYPKVILICVTFIAVWGILHASVGYTDEWLSKALAGDAEAQNHLGLSYQLGIGTAENLRQLNGSDLLRTKAMR